MEPVTRGDPESPLRWTAKSLNTLAGELTAQGHPVSDDTVRRLLAEQGFSLQANAKTLEGSLHADRDAQFHHINEQVKAALAAGEPVISVDTKKKELIGPYKNGRPRIPAMRATPSRSTCTTSSTGSSAKLSPTGCTTSARTPDGSASASITTPRRSPSTPSARWWNTIGKDIYPGAARLLITADSRRVQRQPVRLWKTELAALAAEPAWPIKVCHHPPGTQCRCLAY